MGPGDHAEGGAGGLRHALPRRLGRGLPGRVPRADRHPAASAASMLLRPGHRDRADQARPDAGWSGPSLRTPGHRREEVTFAHRTWSRCWSARLACRCSRSSSWNGSRWATSPDDADLLRRAMGSKRGLERIDSSRSRSMRACQPRYDRRAAEAIYTQILSFANFGFAESHALSFAQLVYASRGSSSTIRPRSWPACSAPSRWASTRRSRWPRTPVVTASTYAAPTSSQPGPAPASSRCRRRREPGPPGSRSAGCPTANAPSGRPARPTHPDPPA